MVDNNYKSVLCLWSGGLDSTFMVHDYLQKGFCVDTLYTEIINNVEKSAREKQAIKNIIEILKPFKEGNYLRDNNFAKAEAYYPSSLIFSQLLPFLYTLIHHVRPHHDYVAMGYVMGDDMISFLPEVERLWKSLTAFLAIKKPPKLVFPLKQMTKVQIWNVLPNSIRNHVTWCESFAGEGDNCGRCKPCKKMESYGLYTFPSKDQEIKLVTSSPSIEEETKCLIMQ